MALSKEPVDFLQSWKVGGDERDGVDFVGSARLWVVDGTVDLVTN